MPDKKYFDSIAHLQQALLVWSYVVLIALPPLLAYYSLGDTFLSYLFSVSLGAAFLVLLIRPLADLTPHNPWIRPLVILRKGLGSFSASIIVAIMLSKVMTGGFGYIAHFFTLAHWSLKDYAIFAPLADISALILLITSNKFSKRTLGANWKRVQKLAYVYFYAGALYEYFVYHEILALVYVVVVAVVTGIAFVHNRSVSQVKTV